MSDNYTNDRLKKAIERNRRKMARKQPPVSPSSQAEVKPSSFRERMKARAELAKSETSRHTLRKSLPSDPNLIEVLPKSRPKKKTKIRYVKASKTTKRMDAKWQRLLLRLSWGFCFVMLLRLVLSHNGVYDYYRKQKKIAKIEKKILNLKSERMAIKKEIQLLRTSPRFQKKMARDHLGVIAKDEYLIVFAQDSDLKSK